MLKYNRGEHPNCIKNRFEKGFIPKNKGIDNRIIKICLVCKNEFKTYNKITKFCSRKCVPKHGFKKGYIPIFKGTKGIAKANPNSFKKGHSVPNEWKEKSRKAIKGRFTGEKNYFYGKHFNGDKAGNWKGGITKSKYYKRLQHFKRRVLRKGRPLSIKTIQQVYEDNIKKYKTLTCNYCLKPIEFGKDCIDHKIPISRDGTNEIRNLTIACRKCNAIKFTKTDKEFKNVISVVA